MDMTSIRVADGSCYLNAIIDCCTREIAASSLDVRCRAQQASAVVDAAVLSRAIRPGQLTLGTDNGTALTARAFRARPAEHGITHRRGGSRDRESQALIESWFSKLRQRCVWREEFETLDHARAVIGAHIDDYHHRPHSGPAYHTPREVAATGKDHDDQPTPAA
jgi:putative transposase